jgi:hypothetical protein
MRYLRHEYILLSACVAAVVAFYCLRNSTSAVDAAICAGFTVTVFAYSRRKRTHGFFAGDDARSLTEILLAHTVCLAAVVMVLRTGMFGSTLPAWMNLPVVADTSGREIGPTSFQILQAVAIYFLGYFEFRILTDPKPRNLEKEEKKALTALWKKAALDAERMDGLRFR